MKRNAVIQVTLAEDGHTSVFLDGKLISECHINSEEEFVEYLAVATDDFWWWLGEAWRGQLEEIEKMADWTDEEEDEDD